MRLGIVYHMPFWREADGTLREVEGSFARYVDSLAPYFDEISLCVPVVSRPAGAEGTAIRSSNVTLAPLPPFDGPMHFYPRLPRVIPRLLRWAREIDLLALQRAESGGGVRVRDRPRVPQTGVSSRRRRPAGAAAVDAVSGREEGAVARLHRVRRTQHPVDGQQRADVCQRRGTGQEAHRPGRPSSRRRLRRFMQAMWRPARQLPGPARARVDRQPDRSAEGTSRASGRDPAARATRASTYGSTSSGLPSARPGREEEAAIVEAAARLGVADRLGVIGAMPLDRLLPMYAELRPVRAADAARARAFRASCSKR